MKLTKYWTKHQEFTFRILWTGEADHRRELMLCFPFRELSIGFDW
jgi:hypothetical protein